METTIMESHNGNPIVVTPLWKPILENPSRKPHHGKKPSFPTQRALAPAYAPAPTVGVGAPSSRPNLTARWAISSVVSWLTTSRRRLVIGWARYYGWLRGVACGVVRLCTYLTGTFAHSTRHFYRKNN